MSYLDCCVLYICKRLIVIYISVFIIGAIIFVGKHTIEEFQVRQYGKPVIVEVVDKKEYSTMRGNSYEIKYKIKDKTYLGNIDKELYKKLDKGTKIEVLEYKGKTIMYDSYDVK